MTPCCYARPERSYSGQPIRYPVEEKGRFEPVSINKWINDRTILSKPYAPMPDDTGAGVELGDQ
jgi:N-acyl-D-amino-acid deacylase